MRSRKFCAWLYYSIFILLAICINEWASNEWNTLFSITVTYELKKEEKIKLTLFEIEQPYWISCQMARDVTTKQLSSFFLFIVIAVYTLWRTTLLAGSESTKSIGIAFTTAVNELATSATLGIVIPAQCRARTGSEISLHSAYVRQFYCKSSSITMRSSAMRNDYREMFRSNTDSKQILNKFDALERLLFTFNRLMCAEWSRNTLLLYYTWDN